MYSFTPARMTLPKITEVIRPMWMSRKRISLKKILIPILWEFHIMYFDNIYPKFVSLTLPRAIPTFLHCSTSCCLIIFIIFITSTTTRFTPLRKPNSSFPRSHQFFIAPQLDGDSWPPLYSILECWSCAAGLRQASTVCECVTAMEPSCPEDTALLRSSSTSGS